MQYSHSYQDPHTGDIVDVMVDDEYRNGPRDHRGGGGRTILHRPRREFTPPPAQGGIVPPRIRERGEVVRHHGSAPQPHPGQTGDYLAIPKAALVEIIPTLGQVWASFLGRPDMPQAVGDDVIDRDNAAMHRDALAMHQQNQTRIQALTDLAARAVRLLVA